MKATMAFVFRNAPWLLFAITSVIAALVLRFFLREIVLEYKTVMSIVFVISFLIGSMCYALGSFWLLREVLKAKGVKFWAIVALVSIVLGLVVSDLFLSRLASLFGIDYASLSNEPFKFHAAHLMRLFSCAALFLWTASACAVERATPRVPATFLQFATLHLVAYIVSTHVPILVRPLWFGSSDMLTDPNWAQFFRHENAVRSYMYMYTFTISHCWWNFFMANSLFKFARCGPTSVDRVSAVLMTIGLGRIFRFGSLSVRCPPEEQNGVKTFSVDETYRITGRLATGAAWVVLLVTALFFIPNGTLLCLMALPLVVILFLQWLGYILTFYHSNVRLETSDKFLMSTRIAGKTSVVKWDDITEVEYIPRFASVRFQDATNVVYVSILLTCFSHFVELMKENLNLPQCQDTLKCLDGLNRSEINR